jgi:Flp pilus assembly protein TadG
MKVILNCKGTALLEFALILISLILLSLGMIEFGLIAYDKQVITNASREGARWAIVNPSPASAAPRRTTSSVEGVVQEYWTKNKLITFGSNTPTSSIKDVVTDTDIITTQNVCSDATPPDKDILVEVTYQYEFLVFDIILNFLGGSQNNTFSISGSTIMRCEAPS